MRKWRICLYRLYCVVNMAKGQVVLPYHGGGGGGDDITATGYNSVV